MPTLAQLIRSKTLWFSALVAALSVAQGYLGLLPLTPVRQMAVGIGISVAIVVLRFLTDRSLAEK